MRNDICLLLTSTIEVKNKSLVRRNDTLVRLNDYKTALKKWLLKQKSLSKIVFVDNSGYPLDELKEVVRGNNPFNKEVEFVSFNSSEDLQLDRSRGELKTIDFALENSEIIKTCDCFAKVTGRVFIKNIDKIALSIPDYFHIVSNFSNNLTYIDTVVIFFQKDYYKKHIAEYAKLNANDEERLYIERVYAKAVLQTIAEDYRWFPLGREPVIDGMSGTKNKPYSRSWISYLKGNIYSKLYYNFYKTSYGKNRKHLLEKWNIIPRS